MTDDGLSSADKHLSLTDKGYSSTAAGLSSAVARSPFALTETSSATSPQTADVESNSLRRVEIVLTVVMPGRVKRNAWSLTVARAAVEAIVGATGEKPVMERDLRTGFEGYWLVEGDAMEIKRRMCVIESSHILGRLFDIDVLRPDATPISRQEVGLTPRRCLICGSIHLYHLPKSIERSFYSFSKKYTCNIIRTIWQKILKYIKYTYIL